MLPPAPMQPLSGSASSTDILTALKAISNNLNVVATNIGAISGTLSGVQLYQGQLPTSSGLLYSADSVSASSLNCINICNTTAGAITLYLFAVPSGGSAAASNAIFYGNSIAANTTVVWEGAIVLPKGGTVYGYSGSAGLTLTISGSNAV